MARKELRIGKKRKIEIDKRVALSKLVVIIFAFLIGSQIYRALNLQFDSLILKFLIWLGVVVLTNIILFIVLFFMIKLILGRDSFLLALGIEPHDHRYNSTIGIFFLMRNIFRLRK